MKLQDLGVCTMPGCFDAAKWVHGMPVFDQNGAEVYPWRVCDCCHESVQAADALLHGSDAHVAGISDPNEVEWCFEASRVAIQQMKKLEGKKP